MEDKCKGCNNVKGCIACVNGSQWAHYHEMQASKAEEWALKQFPVDMQLEPTPNGGVWEADVNRFKRRWAAKVYELVMEELMKDAVEAEIYGVQLILQDGIPKGLSDNDKVKVIIIKE